MSAGDRDLRVLGHIEGYCVQIRDAVALFGPDAELFAESSVYHNAVALCILQIGELVGILSETFRTGHPEIPWREIRLMRNIVAHRYGSVDHMIVWDVVTNDIPVLEQFCRTILDAALEAAGTDRDSERPSS